jgi:hypothetical protein
MVSESDVNDAANATRHPVEVRRSAMISIATENFLAIVEANVRIVIYIVSHAYCLFAIRI